MPDGASAHTQHPFGSGDFLTFDQNFATCSGVNSWGMEAHSFRVMVPFLFHQGGTVFVSSSIAKGRVDVWAIYSTPEDLTRYIEETLQTTPFTTAERNAINRYLDNGITAWPSAPCIPPEHPCFATDGVESTPGGSCMRVIVVNNGTKAAFRNLLVNAITKYPQSQALRAFRDLLDIPWYAVDPYPPPAGFFTGMTC